MYEHASKINRKLWEQHPQLTNEIINTIIEFGRIAKFRCRSNVAYKNFVDACFKGIADVQEVKAERTSDGKEYTYLQATITSTWTQEECDAIREAEQDQQLTYKQDQQVHEHRQGRS